MKVKDLLLLLAEADPDAEVILQKDPEGNGYSPLADAYTDAVYIPESSWGGQVYSTSWSAEAACMTKGAWAKVLKRPRCVVLCPTN